MPSMNYITENSGGSKHTFCKNAFYKKYKFSKDSRFDIDIITGGSI